MPLSSDFKETVRARAEHDPKFREDLLREAVECLLVADARTCKVILRDYLNGKVNQA